MDTSEDKSAPSGITLTPNELYRSAMRMRLTRAGLVKIMRENDERDAARAESALATSATLEP